MLPLPRKDTPRCTKCRACHDFSNAISKVLRLSRKSGAPSRARDNIQSHYRVLKCCPCHAKTRPGAQSAAPATISATPSPKCCACHANQGPPTARARQHPIPLQSSHMLPLPRKDTPRCTKCCACHNFSNAISKALRLSRKSGAPSRARDNIQSHYRVLKCCPCHAKTRPGAQSAAPATISATPSPKCCACHANQGPPTARARQHLIPLQSSHMLPLPRKDTPRCTKCCACHNFSNTISKALRLSRKSGAPSRARDNIQSHYRVLKCCPCHAKTRPGAQNAAPATTSATPSPKCCACHANHLPPAARATTSNPITEFSHAAPATQRHAQVHKMLRLPRFQQRHLQSAAPVTISATPSPKRCACHANQGPPAARATTSNPITEFSHAAPATQRHAQVHKMLRLPRLQ